MHPAPVLFAFLVSFLIPFHSVAPQQPQQPQITPLQQGTTTERNITVGQTHLYSIKLEAGQFAQIVLDQHGIDLIIAVVDPRQKKLGDFDSPNGDDGPEEVPIVADTEGEYILAVRPLNQGESIKPGKYEIRIVDLRKASEQELSAIADREALQAKALALVKDASLSIPQIRSLPIRVHVQMHAAMLLWSTDEKAASKLMNDAVVNLKELLSEIDYDDQDSMQKLQPVTVLRYELIQALGARDPEAALNVLRATRPAANPDVMAAMGNGGREDELELALANEVGKRDPQKAYAIARENLKTRLSPNLIQTVLQLNRRDPVLARKLASEINAKLLQEKLVTNREATDLAINLLGMRMANRPRPVTDANSQVPVEARETPLLSDQDRRDLLQKAMNEGLAVSTSGSAQTEQYSASVPSNAWQDRQTAIGLLNMLKQLGPELESQFPGSQATIDKRLAELQKASDPQTAAWMKYQQAMNKSSPEAAVESINQSPPEMRQQLFQQLADRTAANGDLNRARQIINEKIPNQWQRRQALQNLDRQAVYQHLAKGRVEDALRLLAELQPARVRAQILAQVARQIGPGRKRAVAISLLEQARSMLGDSPQADNQDEMSAMMELAVAFARYDTKRSFEILDPLVDQFNEINDAARKLSGFSYESHKDGEVDIFNGNLVMTLATQLSRALASLATSNFERAKADVDRIQAPEIRLIVNLGIAEEIIKPNRQGSGQ